MDPSLPPPLTAVLHQSQQAQASLDTLAASAVLDQSALHVMEKLIGIGVMSLRPLPVIAPSGMDAHHQLLPVSQVHVPSANTDIAQDDGANMDDHLSAPSAESLNDDSSDYESDHDESSSSSSSNTQSHGSTAASGKPLSTAAQKSSM
jgi:hypothetical protein